MASTTWILICDSSRARVFEHQPGSALELLDDEDRPELRDREQQRDADRPGRVHERRGQKRHAMEPTSSADERGRERFARELADRLREGANNNHFDRLLLVAPPAMLGTLREVLDGPVRERVIGELDKDLTWVAERDLASHLERWITLAETRQPG